MFGICVILSDASTSLYTRVRLLSAHLVVFGAKRLNESSWSFLSSANGELLPNCDVKIGPFVLKTELSFSDMLERDVRNLYVQLGDHQAKFIAMKILLLSLYMRYKLRCQFLYKIEGCWDTFPSLSRTILLGDNIIWAYTYLSIHEFVKPNS